MENLQEFLSNHRKLVHHALNEYLDKKVSEMKKEVNEALLSLLRSYILRGKMIRACLLGLGEQLFLGKTSPHSVKAGAAMELFQSFLIIHDDIMDDDSTRRGFPAMHIVAQDFAKNPKDAQSIAICLGDVVAMMGYELLSSLSLPAERVTACLRYTTQSLEEVGMAQIDDVQNLHRSVDTILHLHEKKTAGYSFSLPLQLGAIIANASKEDQDTLSRFGKYAGVLFQIRDDELDVYGNARETGKPVGSDFQQGKVTLSLAVYAQVFGYEMLQEKVFAVPFSLAQKELQKPEVRQQVQEIICDYEKSAQKEINNLKDALPGQIGYLKELLLLVSQREG